MEQCFTQVRQYLFVWSRNSWLTLTMSSSIPSLQVNAKYIFDVSATRDSSQRYVRDILVSRRRGSPRMSYRTWLLPRIKRAGSFSQPEMGREQTRIEGVPLSGSTMRNSAAGR